MKYVKLISTITLMGLVLAGCSSNGTENSSNSSKKDVTELHSGTKNSIDESNSVNMSSTSEQEMSLTSSSTEGQVDFGGIEENAILNGDYTSLNGTWKNSNGYQLIFNNGTVTLSGEGVGGSTNFTLSEPHKQSNVIYLSFDPAPAPNGMNLMIALKDTSPSDGLEDATDSSRDRIMMGNNGGTMLFTSKENGGIPDTAYYKEN